MVSEAGVKIRTKGYKKFVEAITMNPHKVKSLDDYLQVNHTIDETQSSPRAVELSFYDSYKNAFLNGCDYLELRWNPHKRSQNFKIDLDRLIVSARAGYEKANSIFGINGSMIFCLGRDCSEEQNEAIFKKAIQYYKRGVGGIDVAGPEEKIPLKPEFEEYYKIANAMGLLTTIHCGEPFYEGVGDTLATVLEKYKPRRLGHGIQLHRYPKLMKITSRAGIVLEICISSNLMTRAVASMKEFLNIFRIFEEYNVKYVLCTDATFSLKTNILNEYRIYDAIKNGKIEEIEKINPKKSYGGKH